MSKEFIYDVFLSYSPKDKQVAEALIKRLKADGLKVTSDRAKLKQVRTFVPCMSPDYFTSEWKSLEHRTLLFRDSANIQQHFLPLLTRDCSLPDSIAQFTCIDWQTPSDEKYKDLLEACRPKIARDKIQEPAEIKASKVLKGHIDSVWSVAITPDQRFAVSGSGLEEKSIRIWDLASGNCVGILKGHTGGIPGLAVTQDGRFVVSGSHDKTIRVWDIATKTCITTLKGHTASIIGRAVTSVGSRVVSCSRDRTVRVWDLKSYKCITILKGHTGAVLGVAVTANGKRALSGSTDNTIRLWDIDSGKCLAVLKGHTDSIRNVAITSDGSRAVSVSYDKTVRIWDLESYTCIATLEGHTNAVLGVAITPDGRRAISGSGDNTLRVWDLEAGQCIATLIGHTDIIEGVAITPNGRLAISGSADKTVRVWDLPPIDKSTSVTGPRYTNAKIVLVGKTGVGKTGLALRLCEDRWEPTESTHGMIVTKLELDPVVGTSSMEREVWLWDFAGQPDYRLIHQLYMDETALAILVFDPQDDNPFEEIGYWEKALLAATKYTSAKLLVAARCDRGGITISQKRFNEYVQKHGFAGFLITGAKTGDGCRELIKAISSYIPWERLPWTATSRLFKTLKDAILTLTEEKSPIIRLPELRQRLQLLLPGEFFHETELRAVVGLMQGQGVVQMLDFGDFILLKPEWINRYASVVVRMAREHTDEMGVVPEQQVLDGRLDYKDMKRLGKADEKILLRAMVQTFLERSLCLREETIKGTMHVFPSYFRRDKPDLPEHPNVFVTYGFAGPLDEIYSTLVVRLSYSDGFAIDQLWKDAADFKTHTGKRVGLAMKKKAEGTAEIVVYFEAGVPDDTAVTFIKYIHEHLLSRIQPRESVTRVRTYVCKYCDEPLENRRAIQIRLSKGLKDIACPICEKRIPLIDLIEEKFASDEFLCKVRELDERARINLDNESRELILVGHAMAIAAEAGQIFRPVTLADWGIDGEIEFKNNKGQASGQRVYLQLKSGDSYLYHRKRDDADIFTIKNPRHAEYWLSQAYPVMLVIRTSEGKIRWMNVTSYLQQHGKNTKQIIFEGELFTALNVVNLRNRILSDIEE